MPTADQVIVELQARINSYMRNVATAERRFTGAMRSVEKSSTRTGGIVEGTFRGLAAGLLSVQAVRAAIGLVDASNRITNALKIAGLEGAELTRVYDSLYTSAQRNAAPFEALATLYGRVSLVQKDLNLSTSELLAFTENVAVALRVSGKSAEEASGALLQLSQALGGGIVRAEEFNSILEGALPIAQAAAAGLEEAGGSVAKLRALVIDGKVSSEAFFRAFEAGSVILGEKLAGAELTVSQGFVRMMNVLIDSAGRLDDAYDVSGNLTRALEALGEEVGNFTQFLIENKGPILEFIGNVESVLNGLDEWFRKSGETLGRRTGLNQVAPLIEDLTGIPVAGQRRAARGQVITRTFELLAATPQDAAIAEALGISTGLGPVGPATGRRGRPNITPKLKPVSLSDFDLPGSDATGKTKAVTEGYKIMAAAAEEANRKQQEWLDSLHEMETAVAGIVSGFVSDLRQGVSAAEAFSNALGNIADQLIQMAINNLVGAAFGMATGNIGLGLGMGATGRGVYGGTGGFFPGFPGMASGTANTGGRRGEVRGLVHGQEAVIPLPDGGRVPVMLKNGNGVGAGRILIELGDGLEASILNKAAGQDIEIIRTMVPPMINRAAPTAVASASRNRVA